MRQAAPGQDQLCSMMSSRDLLPLIVRLPVNVFPPVGKDKEEIKVNTFQGCDTEFAHIISICSPLAVTLSPDLTTPGGSWHRLLPQRGKDEVTA